MKKNNIQIQMGDPIRKKFRRIPFQDVKQVPYHLHCIRYYEQSTGDLKYGVVVV